MYTKEQQARLGVDENGKALNKGGEGATGWCPESPLQMCKMLCRKLPECADGS